MATHYPNEILGELLTRFQPGTVPHYFVMKTLGDVVSANGTSSLCFITLLALDTIPKLKEIMARVLPVLSSVKIESIRWVFATGNQIFWLDSFS